MMKHNILIIYGSVRHHRQGIRGARFMVNQVKARGHNVFFLDVMDHSLPLLDKMYKEYKAGEVPEEMEKIAEKIRWADAYLIVTGEYNHGIPPALKNLLDHYQQEYLFKPSAIASYSGGSFGGVRAAVHLRVVVAELGMPAISSQFAMPQVGKIFDESGKPYDEGYPDKAKKFLDELEWYTLALKNARAEGTPF